MLQNAGHPDHHEPSGVTFLRSPLAIALLFTLLLAGWLASGPIQRRLAAAPAAPIALAEPVARRMTVRVVESAAQPIAPEIVVNGHTAPVRAVELKAETSGRVIEVPVSEGSVVDGGTVLARLDLRDRESRVRQMAAALAQRELEYGAARKLGAKQFSSETRVAEALSQLEEARAELLEMRLDLAHTAIAAPFKGVVEQRMVEVGDFVEAGDPVAMVIEQDPFLVVGDAPEAMVARFEVGEPGVAQLADGRTAPGHIRFVATQADEATRTFRVELEVAQPRGPAAGRDERPDRRARARDPGASGRRRRSWCWPTMARSASRRSTPTARSASTRHGSSRPTPMPCGWPDCRSGCA